MTASTPRWLLGQFCESDGPSFCARGEKHETQPRQATIQRTFSVPRTMPELLLRFCLLCGCTKRHQPLLACHTLGRLVACVVSATLATPDILFAFSSLRICYIVPESTVDKVL